VAQIPPDFATKVGAMRANDSTRNSLAPSGRDSSEFKALQRAVAKANGNVDQARRNVARLMNVKADALSPRLLRMIDQLLADERRP
jgi:hypothetical protein